VEVPVPLYEEPEGLVIVQSAAIVRHLARKHGYSGANAHEEALIDQANEGVVEAFAGVFKAAFGSPEDKADAQEKLLRETLPAQLALFETLLERNGNNGHFVGAKLSYADINLWVTLQFFFVLVESSRHSLLRGFPAVKKLADGVAERERVKAYVARDVLHLRN
jgi:glutathione S-transferase